MVTNKIYEDADIYIERENAEIPWVKIFTRHPYIELTDCPEALRKKLYAGCEIVENVMRNYYQPTKINIASFGNYVPHVHIHIMARFETDSFFPEPMWGKKQREGRLELPPFEPFAQQVANKMSQLFARQN